MATIVWWLVSAAWALEDWVLPTEVKAAVEESRNWPLGLRIKRISEPMLGKPYVRQPEGEGVGLDPDPVVRYDRYDCLTFVEDVLALALSSDSGSAAMIRDHLRYRNGERRYQHRNHFMMPQWIHYNLQNRLLVDVTTQFGKGRSTTKKWFARQWKRWKGRHRFKLKEDEFPVGKFTYRVLSLERAMKVYQRFPEGSIFLVLRESHPYNPIMVTHLGFFIKKGKRPWIRHATRMGKRVVRDDRLPWYFTHLQTFKWPVRGIMVLMPQEQGPRRIIPPADPETAMLKEHSTSFKSTQ